MLMLHTSFDNKNTWVIRKIYTGKIIFQSKFFFIIFMYGIFLGLKEKEKLSIHRKNGMVRWQINFK